jgi:hypothetical protein
MTTTPALRETHGAEVVGVLCGNNLNIRPAPFKFNERQVMTSKTRHIGTALLHVSRPELQPTERSNFSHGCAPCTDLQRRYLMRRCGVRSRQASLIAALCFGEDRK